MLQAVTANMGGVVAFPSKLGEAIGGLVIGKIGQSGHQRGQKTTDRPIYPTGREEQKRSQSFLTPDGLNVADSSSEEDLATTQQYKVDYPIELNGKMITKRGVLKVLPKKRF